MQHSLPGALTACSNHHMQRSPPATNYMQPSTYSALSAQLITCRTDHRQPITCSTHHLQHQPPAVSSSTHRLKVSNLLPELCIWYLLPAVPFTNEPCVNPAEQQVRANQREKPTKHGAYWKGVWNATPLFHCLVLPQLWTKPSIHPRWMNGRSALRRCHLGSGRLSPREKRSPL